MKLITWNVNGIRAVERKGELEKLIQMYDPDVFLVQETKCKAEQVSVLDTTYPKYTKFYVSAAKAGYSGVSAWVKQKNSHRSTETDSESQEKKYFSDIQFKTPKIGTFDDEGRIVETTFEHDAKKYAVIGCYFPNGGKSDEAWQGKLVFYDQFLEYVNNLRQQGYNVIWGGDVNCAHNEIDLARPKNNNGKIGFHPLERRWMDKVIKNNWSDIWREKNPDTVDVYSWWHVITRSRARNIGWRIDYWFCDRVLFSDIKKIEYLTNQMGSDHCPVLLET
jgi:exodeoxyribonuclease-3